MAPHRYSRGAIALLKTIIFTTIFLAFVAALTIYITSRRDTPPVSQVFTNGNIITMDSDNSVVQAIALQNDKIIAAGSNEDIQEYISKDTLVHNLQGKTLMPGIVDAHSHFPGVGMYVTTADLSSPPVGSISNIAELQARLRERLQGKSAGKWLTGLGYDDTLLTEHRHPTKEELDAVSTEHPIFITHVSGHVGVANSLALAIAGYDHSTPDPEGGHIVRDDKGELTGLLEETAAAPLTLKMLDISPTQVYEMIREAAQIYAAAGVTTAQSGGLDGAMLKGLYYGSELGLIPQRLELWSSLLIGEELISGEFNLDDYNNDYVHSRTVKIIADGSIQGFTGFLSHPYHTPFRGDENHQGYPTMSREKLTQWVSRLHKAGFQLAIHGNGDAAIDDIIYAFEQAQQRHPNDDPRLILIHSQMAREDQLEDMKRLGISPSFFSAHTYYWGDRHRDIFMGPERAQRMSPAFSAQQKGLRFSVHLDSPVVPMDPMLLVWSTVNRISSSGKVIGAEQRIDTMSALRAVTIDAAWQIFQEHRIGSLEPGKLADLIVLDADPLQDPLSIKDIKVVHTYVGGVKIFDRHQ